MKTYDIPKLTPEEVALPVSKYYTDYPLHYPNPLYSQLLKLGAMDPKDAIPVENCFDPETPDFMLCEQYLRDVQIHNTVEQQHLATFLPALYAEYKDKEKDAD